MSLPLDPALIRAEFPAFSEPSLLGQAFFENAGGSYTSRQVLDRLQHYYTATKLQPYGHFEVSQQAGAAMDLAFERMAQALNVPTDWIQIGPSTSANTYVLGKAFAQFLKPGDAVIVTNQDHEANTGNWRKLSDLGIEVREWGVEADTGHLDLNALDYLLDDKVRLMAFPHASNIVAEINPAAEICARAKAVGAWTVVDGVSYAPHGLPDVSAIGCDVYLFSAYKTYGPHQGVMAVSPDLNRALPNQGHYFNADKLRYRLTPAGPDHAQIAACAGLADYLERVAEIAGPEFEGNTAFVRAHNAMRAQEKALLAPLMDFLRGHNAIRILGTTDLDKRAPTVALASEATGADLAQRLAKHGIMAGGGHFYAVRLLEALGVDPENGVLRLSFTHYTSPEEIALLIKALEAEL